MVSPEEARTNMLSRPRAAGPEVAKVEDRTISSGGPGGGYQVPVRIYTPPGAGPFPVLSWFHGGGWVIGNLETADPTARHLTVQTGCVVVSVDYRLAPESKFPVPFDDCYAATEWIAKNAASINGDASRIAVGGDSAGGNLAAGVAIAAKERGRLRLAFQLLVYPVTARDYETASYKRNANGYSLTMDGMKWFWDHYLSSDADAENPYAAPMAAKDLSGLPPALVITAEFDPLCDEGEAYAARLKAAGVSTTASRYDGMIHGFFGMSGVVDKAALAVAEAAEALKKAFATAKSPAAR
jgi:acetyl esterase